MARSIKKVKFNPGTGMFEEGYTKPRRKFLFYFWLFFLLFNVTLLVWKVPTINSFFFDLIDRTSVFWMEDNDANVADKDDNRDDYSASDIKQLEIQVSKWIVGMETAKMSGDKIDPMIYQTTGTNLKLLKKTNSPRYSELKKKYDEL